MIDTKTHLVAQPRLLARRLVAQSRLLAHPMSTRCRIALMLWEDRMTRKPAPITLAPVLWLTRKDI